MRERGNSSHAPDCQPKKHHPNALHGGPEHATFPRQFLSRWILLSLVATIAAGCQPSSKPESARRTPFDNGDSGLDAGNVHSAIDELAARIATLQADVNAANATIATLQAELNAAAADIGDHEGRLDQAELAVLDHDTRLGAAEAAVADHETRLGGAEVAVTNHETRLDGLELKTVAMTAGVIDGFPSVAFTAVNVHVRSGGGTTDAAVNGLGNLVVGYHENAGTFARTGSHNLVVGKDHGYASHGGAVLGLSNRSMGAYATVTGGSGSMASGEFSAVSGGSGNLANGQYSSISAGIGSVASGQYSSVSGGGFNFASGVSASVSGGNLNTASGGAASVSGGGDNVASANGASVSGGLSRSALGENDWRAGGLLQDN